MELKTLIISLLAFSGVVIGLNLYVLDLSGHYSKNIEDTSMLSQASAIEQSVNDMKAAFDFHLTGTLIDVPLSAITGIIEFTKLITYSIFGFWDTLLSGPIVSILHLPAWFTTIISAIIMTIIVFAAIHVIKWGY